MTRANLEAFLAMLVTERGAAENSLAAYRHDVEDYLAFLGSRRIGELDAKSKIELPGYGQDLDIA